MPRLPADGRVWSSVALVAGLAAVALWPQAVAVEVAQVSRGPLIVTIDEEGRTRVRDRFVVAAPVTGRLVRIEFEPGDRIERGTILARLQPELPPLLDERTRAEAVAALASAEAALDAARAGERRARAASTHAQRELSRSRTLMAAGATARQDLDTRAIEASIAAEAVEGAAAAVQAAAAEVERARARVAASGPAPRSATVVVRAPAGGVVLQRVRESEGLVRAGEPLLEIGDPQRIEIVTDLLTTDAVRVTPGASATIDQWGGGTALAATVRRVEPAGVTRLSALGVEEQRVSVVLDLVDARETCAGLGDAYRVETRIVVWEAADAVKVPTSALFRDGGRWAVFVATDGRARRRFVEIGHHTGTVAEVTAGLTPGATVVVHPGDLLRDGDRIALPSSR